MLIIPNRAAFVPARSFHKLCCCLLVALSFVMVSIPAAAIDLRSATVQDINRAFDAGTLTSEELVRRYLARIEAYNEQGPALRAVISVAPNVLERARELDEERRVSGPRSPLHGIPIIVKDTVDTIDAPTSGGAIGYANTYPLLDATVVRKVKEAGAIILGKGNLDEFNLGSSGVSSVFGQTLNPYDLTRNPGGSSSGPGVSVTAGFATLGIGTETGASIRSPSSNSLRGARIGVLRDLFREGEEYADINGLIEKEIAVLIEQGAVVMDGLSTGIDLIEFFPLARASTEEFLEAFRVYAERRGDTLPYPTLQALVDSGQMLERLQESYKGYIAEGSTEFDPLYLAKLQNRETIRQLLVDLMDKYQLDALV